MGNIYMKAILYFVFFFQNIFLLRIFKTRRSTKNWYIAVNKRKQYENSEQFYIDMSLEYRIPGNYEDLTSQGKLIPKEDQLKHTKTGRKLIRAEIDTLITFLGYHKHFVDKDDLVTLLQKIDTRDKNLCDRIVKLICECPD